MHKQLWGKVGLSQEVRLLVCYPAQEAERVGKRSPELMGGGVLQGFNSCVCVISTVAYIKMLDIKLKQEHLLYILATMQKRFRM